MRLVTWNVNSLGRRFHQVTTLLDELAPDVLALQETKRADIDEFSDLFTARGYTCTHTGAPGGYNGVALATRLEATSSLAYGTDGRLSEPPPSGQSVLDAEPRLVIVETPVADFASVYVPNGRELDHWHYRYKLAWLAELARLAGHRTGRLVLLGDFNVAPRDADVWNPRAWVGRTHVSPEERAALAELADVGKLADAALLADNAGFTWWNYRGRGFAANQGLRIDLALVPRAWSERLVRVETLRAYRALAPASDHAPLLVELTDR